MKYPQILITALLLLSVGICQPLRAQINPEALPTQQLFNQFDIELRPEKLNSREYRCTIVYTPDETKKETFIVRPMLENTFRAAFHENLGKLYDNINRTKPQENKLDAEADRVYYLIMSTGIYAGQVNYAPDAGKLCFNKKIKIERRIISGNISKKNLATSEVLNDIKVYSLTADDNRKKKQYFYTYRNFQLDLLDLEGSLEDSGDTEFKLDSSYREVTNNKHLPIQRLVLARKIYSIEKNRKIESKKTGIHAINISINNTIAQIDSLQMLYKAVKEAYQRELKQNSTDSLEKLLRKKRPIVARIAEKAAWKVLLPKKKDNYVLILQHKYRNSYLYKDSLEGEDFILEFTPIEQHHSNNIKRHKELETFLKSDLNNEKLKSEKSYNKLLSDFLFLDTLLTTKSRKKYSQQEKETFLNDVEEKIKDKDTERRNLKNLLEDLKEYQELLTEYNIRKQFYTPIQKSYQNELDSLESKIKYYKDKNQKLKQEKVSDEANIKHFLKLDPYPEYVIETVTIEFNDGFIENIRVFGHLAHDKQQAIQFYNIAPIGFSRKRDFDNLSLFYLSQDVDSITQVVQTQYKMKLSDLIANYQHNHALNRRDFSPRNHTKIFYLEKDLCYTLKKAPTYQLFEARVFSDFVGLDSDEPNGLIQTEIKKKIHLITRRRDYRFLGINPNTGFLGHIEPGIVISKLENNNRRLKISPRNMIVNNQHYRQRVVGLLQLRNFEFISAGLNLNIFTVDVPRWKSTFFANFHSYFSRTALVDSIQVFENGNLNLSGQVEEFGVNSLRWGGQIKMLVEPDERYGVEMNYTANWSRLFDNRVKQVNNLDEFILLGNDSKENGNSRILNYDQIAITAWFVPSVETPSGKLFFRYQYFTSWNQPNQNFHQAQLGYTFFLMVRNKDNQTKN